MTRNQDATARLHLATLCYGRRYYHVKPEPHIAPLPETFDFDDAENCARKIFACMSNASGGHPLAECRLRMHLGRRTANMVANGAHVFYAPHARQMLTAEMALQIERETIVVELGTVRATGYGGGHAHAKWTPAPTSGK